MNHSSPVLLNLSLIQPGDVFLSRPRALESWLIAKFGGSRFSHAEIVVGSLDSGLSAYEATTDDTSKGKTIGLVRWKILADCLYRLVPPSNTASPQERQKHYSRPLEELMPVLVKDISKYAEFEVLRWRGPLTSQFEQFQQNLESSCRQFNLEPYANLDALARLTACPIVVKFLGSLGGWIPEHVRKGLFCSQLVALAYQIGGHPLFSDRESKDVTPQALAELAEISNGPLKIVPREELRFSPEVRHELYKDWRKENHDLLLHVNDEAYNVRVAERIQQVIRDILQSSRKPGE